VVITGNCGPNAVKTLSAAGIELIVGQAGTVRQAIDNYQKGELKNATDANVGDHHGMGGETTFKENPIQRPGGGMGVGRGLGRGRGMR